MRLSLLFVAALCAHANEEMMSCTNEVTVSVPAAGSIGVQLDSSLTVLSFGSASPVRASGVVAVGDRLMAVNGHAVAALSALSGLLRKNRKAAGHAVRQNRNAKDRRLTFLVAEALCSASPASNEEEGQCTNDVTISVPATGSIGIQLDGSLTVLSFAHASPVEASGAVAVGDRLSAVNGIPIEALSALGGLLRPKPGSAEDRRLTFRVAKATCASASRTATRTTSGTLSLTRDSKELLRADFRLAHFGGAPPLGRPLKAVLGEPLNACSPLLNAADVRGAAVILTRGECAFIVKSRHAMAAGAALVVFMNSEEGLPRLPAQGSTPSDTVPVVMVTQFARRRLRQFVEADDGSASLTLEDDPSVDRVWQELHGLCLDVKRHWPDTARERRKRYFALSREHHPDKPKGSDERFETLRYAYKKAVYHSDPELQKQMHFDEFLASV